MPIYTVASGLPSSHHSCPSVSYDKPPPLSGAFHQDSLSTWTYFHTRPALR